MYQYGNVAVKYQDPQRKRAQEHTVPKQPSPRKPPKKQQNRQKQRNKQQTAAVQPRTSRMPVWEKCTYLLFVAVVMVVCTLLLALQATIAQTSYETQQVQGEAAEVTEVNEQLQVEATALSSPERIIAIAKEEMGMQTEDTRVKILSESSR